MDVMWYISHIHQLTAPDTYCILGSGDVVYFAHHTLVYGGRCGMKKGFSLWMRALRQKRLGVSFRMWLPVAASAYVFGLALWRALALPEVLPGVLKLVFCVVCLAMIACAAVIPCAKPDEMSVAAYGKAAKYSNRLLMAALWILILLLSPYMDNWFGGFAASRWNLMLYVAGALFASYLFRVLAFIYYDRTGAEDD